MSTVVVVVAGRPSSIVLSLDGKGQDSDDMSDGNSSPNIRVLFHQSSC